MACSGVVKFFNQAKGFGFIETEQGDVFVHANDVQGAPLQEGDEVHYDESFDEAKQKSKASNVTGGTGVEKGFRKGGKFGGFDNFGKKGGFGKGKGKGFGKFGGGGFGKGKFGGGGFGGFGKDKGFNSGGFDGGMKGGFDPMMKGGFGGPPGGMMKGGFGPGPDMGMMNPMGVPPIDGGFIPPEFQH
ncbi:unnamed protein product [Amoebophrya sp. A120]|nr:unnamed protein product [Amoebophrya sp. A120]|eukprot:GSA120T00020688001.1